MNDARITLVTLAVEALDRAAEFYEALGWQRTNAGNDMVVFMQGANLVLSLFGKKDLAADVKLSLEGNAPFPSIALAVNLGSERDVDRLFDKAVAAGATAIKPPEPAFWGGYSGYFADPDGHLWELAFNPFFAMDEGGQLDLLKPGKSAA